MTPKAEKKKSNTQVTNKKIKKVGPKKPLSAYLFFTQERRKTLIDQKPELKSHVTDTIKIIGAEWNKLSAEDKQKYNKLAQDDKERYEKEKSAVK